MEIEEKQTIEILGFNIRTKTIGTAVFLLIAGYFLASWLFSSTIPGHWFEKGNYEAQIYVNIFPENNASKNYRIIGDIERATDCPGEGHDCYSWYILKRATFPNTGYIEFDDCEVKLNKKVYCTESNGAGWDIELTNIPAK